MMTPQSLETYLHEHIPLSAAMGVRVDVATPSQVILKAPLEPNLNHRNTAFGGSISALATLAGWSLIHFRLRSQGIESRLVVAENTVRYTRPVFSDFSAITHEIDDETWQAFIEMIRRKGRGRLQANVDVCAAGETIASFAGRFVALT